MIEIKGVTKKYGDYTAIENVNITVEDSSVFGIAGFNGCGKTTLLNVCAGVFKAEEGAVFLDGADAFDNSKERKEMFYLTDDTWFPVKSSVKGSKNIIQSISLLSILRFLKRFVFCLASIQIPISNHFQRV